MAAPATAPATAAITTGGKDTGLLVREIARAQHPEQIGHRRGRSTDAQSWQGPPASKA